MASSIQYRENANWSCLPCIGGEGGQHGPNPIREQSLDTDNIMKQTEDLLASELSKLSVQERAKAFDDVHCVGEDLQETPEIIEKSLVDFEVAVQKERTRVYDIAWNQNRAYVEDKAFRLQFLRANLHDVKKSVRQMMRYLQHKATYFGIDKVARDITLADLNEDDMRLILSSPYHLQGERDQNGRVILHMVNTSLAAIRVENLIRMLHILCVNMIISDPLQQMKGFVFVYHDVLKKGEKPDHPGFDFMNKLSDTATSFPMRYSAIHYCLQGEQGKLSWNNFLIQNMIKLSPHDVRIRCRIHIGSFIENRYKLQSYGIPMKTIPIDIYGNIRKDIWLSWFYRYQREQQSKIQSGHALNGHENTHSEAAGMQASALPLAMGQSTKPSENDVLLGRGWFAQTWKGNIAFREFITNHLDWYDQLPRNERKKRTIGLTEELAAKGVRFFEQKVSGEWVEADRTEARKKVSQMFRSLRKKRKM